MTRKEYIDQVRPALRLIMSFLLYLRFGSSFPNPALMFPVADTLISEFEKQFKFEEDK